MGHDGRRKRSQYSGGMPPRFTLPSLPTLCAVCRSWADQPVCKACETAYGRLQPRCPGCALPLAPGLELCSSCEKKPDHDLSTCLARVPYTWPWTEVVGEFKFRGRPAWAREMARMMLEIPGVKTWLAGCDGLIPIPLTTHRLVERGYNQSWELARSIGKSVSVPIHAHFLIRHHTTQLQHRLALNDRERHAARAFAIPPDLRDRLENRHWILIDDVMTTGSTLRAAARLLMEAGASEVSALVFARTPAPDPDNHPQEAPQATWVRTA